MYLDSTFIVEMGRFLPGIFSMRMNVAGGAILVRIGIGERFFASPDEKYANDKSNKKNQPDKFSLPIFRHF